MGTQHNPKWFSYTIPTSTPHPSRRQTPNPGVFQRLSGNGIRDLRTFTEEGHRGNHWTRFSVPPIYRAKKERRATPSPQPQAPQCIRAKSTFSNGDNPAGMFPRGKERPHGQRRPFRRFSALFDPQKLTQVSPVCSWRQGVPLPGLMFRVEAEPIGVDQIDKGRASLGPTTRDEVVRLSRRLHPYREDRCDGYAPGPIAATETGRAGPHGQPEEVIPAPQPHDPAFGFYDQLPTDDTLGPAFQDPGSSAGGISPAPPLLHASENSSLFCGQGVGDIVGSTAGPASYTVPPSSEESRAAPQSGQLECRRISSPHRARGTPLVDQAPVFLEWPLLPPGSGTGRGLHRLIPDWFWHRVAAAVFCRDVGHNPTRLIDKLLGIVNHLAGLADPGTARQGNTHLLRQYDVDRLCQALWGHPFRSSDGPRGTDMDALLCDRNETDLDIHPIRFESGGSAITLPGPSTGMGVIANDISYAESTVGPVGRRLLCLPPESSTAGVHVMDVGPTSSMYRRTHCSLDLVGALVPVPTVEPPSAGSPEAAAGAVLGRADHPQLAKRHLVPPGDQDGHRRANPPGSYLSRLRKRHRVPAQGQQQLDPPRVEDPRLTKRPRVDGVSQHVQDLLAQTPVSSVSRGIVSRFLGWCDDNGTVAQPLSAVALVNYLTHGHANLKWSLATVTQYSSVILTHFDAASLRRDPLYKDFFNALNSQHLGSSQLFPNYDIRPILSLLETLGDNATMPIPDLTRKLCWLLAITGFLRPSDIHRIDLDQSTSVDDQLRLAVIAPKEKRQGRPYIKSVIIHSHANVALCPVLAFEQYVACVASSPCRTPHPYRPALTYNHLIRDLRSPSLPVGAERIGRHIKSVMAHLVIDGLPWTGGPLPKARALGSTLAIRNGASTDDAVLHGAWASRSVFEAFYRLSRRPAANLTNATLNW